MRGSGKGKERVAYENGNGIQSWELKVFLLRMDCIYAALHMQYCYNIWYPLYYNDYIYACLPLSYAAACLSVLASWAQLAQLKGL